MSVLTSAAQVSAKTGVIAAMMKMAVETMLGAYMM
jgi:hypothetical protein